MNVFKHLKGNFSLESQGSIIERTSKATGSSISTIKRIIKEERPRSPGKKKPNRTKFTKLDSFDLSVIRRIIHSFYSRNESPTLTKLLKKLKEEINFPYGRTHLFRLLKTLGFKYKKRGRESILNERSDLIMWRESFLRRIREVREKDPERNSLYRRNMVKWRSQGKKGMGGLKSLRNPRRSIKEYGTVGCTKDNVGKGKRIIIVDCITENGPVPGALWIFSAGSKSQKEKQDISFKETAVTIEKAKETVQAVEEQDSGPKNVPSTSTTRSTKRKSKTNEPLAKSKKVKKATDTKNPLNSKNNDVNGNEQSPENEDAGIIEEFDYHDSMNAENYEKYSEKICKLLKPNSLIIIDNASYHSRNSDDYP